MLKEAFAILTQGVEMIHFDVSYSGRGTQINKKIIWMDSDILRLCVDFRRPTLADRAKGKVPPGIYMRDIAVILKGEEAAACYDFAYNQSPPSKPEQCLALVATERAICLELPSGYACDWFYDRLGLVAKDILTTDERIERIEHQILKSRMNLYNLSTTQIEQSEHIGMLLQTGLEVLHHHPDGQIVSSVLSADSDLNILKLKCVDSTFFGYPIAKPLRMHLRDIVELRPGTHSFGFVGTRSTDKHKVCLSIIGSECTLDIQFSNETARNLFAERFRVLLIHLLSQSNGDSIA